MAYNYPQVPFWDFIRSFDQNGVGVDHPAGSFPYGHPFHPPHHGPPHGGFPFGGPDFSNPRGGFGWARGGRQGRACRRDDGSHERCPNEERSTSPHGEQHEGQADEGSPRHDHDHAHGRRGFGHRGRGGRHGGPGHHGHWGPRGPPPFGGPAGFDLSTLFESLAGHPLAQKVRQFAEQAAGQRLGGTLVPEDTETENTFTPPIDVFSTATQYVLHVSLPGAKKEDVGVHWDAEKGVLNLAGVVYRKGDEEFLKSLNSSERKVGVFERSIKLPPGNEEKEEVDGDAIVAKLEDGVLIVNVPKVEKEWTEVKRVDIE